MKLNFFSDIDGTLLPFEKSIPESAVKAILYAKSEGHRLFLSTGRAPFEVPDELLNLPFDGGVFSAGADILFGDKQVFKAQADENQRRFFLDVAEKYNLLWLIQGSANTFVTKKSLDYYYDLSRKANSAVKLRNLKFVESYPEDEPMTKFYIMSEEGRILEARKALEGPFTSVNNTTGLPERNAAELMLAGMTKASGIRKMMAYLGENLDSTVGIGDGENDLDMIQVCHLGIAMGNSCEVLKENADYITDNVDNDGLAKAIHYAIGGEK